MDKEKTKKIRVGISVGDINGVGLEVILKTLNNPQTFINFIPVIYGSSKVISYHKNIVGLEDFQFQSIKSAERLNPNKVNILNCWDENVNITIGQLSEDGGKYAYISLDRAVSDLKKGLIDALVTAPINKKAMQLANFPYPGHTEYLTKEFETKESLMMMVNEDLRVGLVTNHLPIRDVANAVTKKRILEKLHIFNKSLKVDFGKERPMIAILGLNPHAGDEGVIGEEEEKIIRPLIIESKKKGMIVMGPYSADGFFGSGEYKKFDGILAMYHDQGLIPFKSLSFGSGVNYTAGLPIVRTSPDHGTAYDIAGQNQADPASFRQALFLAVDIARNKRNHEEMHSNPVEKREKTTDDKENKPT